MRAAMKQASPLPCPGASRKHHASDSSPGAEIQCPWPALSTHPHRVVRGDPPPPSAPLRDAGRASRLTGELSRLTRRTRTHGLPSAPDVATRSPKKASRRPGNSASCDPARRAAREGDTPTTLAACQAGIVAPAGSRGLAPCEPSVPPCWRPTLHWTASLARAFCCLVFRLSSL